MYSLIATVSVFVATFLAEYIAKHEKLKLKNNIWEIILMVMLFGVIGARLYHVIDFFEYYKTNPIQILNFRAGGLAIYGGVIRGFFFVINFFHDFTIKWISSKLCFIFVKIFFGTLSRN